MKVTTIASTAVGYDLPIDAALDFGGKAAGVCYMADTFQDILNEDKEATSKRIKRTLNAGHHSVYEHNRYTLLFENIPKFLAMIINNEKDYATSEKSARYTKMNLSPEEQILYNKWLDKLKYFIKEEVYGMSDQQIEKAAQENARYMTSVFTPTTLIYTVSLRQINYIIQMMQKFINEEPEIPFYTKTKLLMTEFINKMDKFIVPGMSCEQKNRKLSLFDYSINNSHESHFSETYCTTYLGSFAMLAQAQRHRTIDYKMSLPCRDINEPIYFYTPDIVIDAGLTKEWVDDLISVSHLYPQATLVNITERGTYEKFLEKCMERLCGQAQLEIMHATIDTFKDYRNANARCFEEEIINKGYNLTPRCKFPGWGCKSPCIWGPNMAFLREV